MSLSVGAAAPDFTLEGIDGATGLAGTWTRSDFLGAPLVVVFYPGDNSPVCTAQLREYSRGVASLADLGAAIVAISPQSAESHRNFAAANGGFGFPLLVDEGKAVAREWGNLGLLDLYRRSTFIIDAKGRVSWVHRALGPGLFFKPLDAVVAALAGSS